jgi:hypothetical protein
MYSRFEFSSMCESRPVCRDEYAAEETALLQVMGAKMEPAGSAISEVEVLEKALVECVTSMRVASQAGKVVGSSASGGRVVVSSGAGDEQFVVVVGVVVVDIVRALERD